MTYEEAKQHLGSAVREGGDLYDLGWYLQWYVGSETAVLDGEFSPQDLIAIATYMTGTKDQ